MSNLGTGRFRKLDQAKTLLLDIGIGTTRPVTISSHDTFTVPIHQGKCELTVLHFNTHQMMCFPWQLVVLFGRDSNQEANMGVLLRMITTTTLSRVSADLWNHTDTVHGCLALLGATLKKTPHLLISHHNHLAPLFHLGKFFMIWVANYDTFLDIYFHIIFFLNTTSHLLVKLIYITHKF